MDKVLAIIVIILGIAGMALFIYRICTPKPNESRKATEFECARALTDKHRLTWEYMYWSDGDRWYAVKDRNLNVLFLCKWREMEREILDYYGRLPEDFKVNYKGKVVLR